jgi:hypothetical protein
LLHRLELDRFLDETSPEGREEIPWPLMATVLVTCPHFCNRKRLAPALRPASIWFSTPVTF